ncbi:hypothetical protein C8F04DRAFT_1277127 [Mycena alexandri]|uniref:SMP-30/Gluconolactonase/LRE-like region domain-containing protein n=1 Tax=Mycena alexandri TaxID=1745969 RepID=A0AAD6S060_9AGAR|nr:hypothetical protein C8F04DRAFT_1277127 [Mycena alexandri]
MVSIEEIITLRTLRTPKRARTSSENASKYHDTTSNGLLSDYVQYIPPMAQDGRSGIRELKTREESAVFFLLSTLSISARAIRSRVIYQSPTSLENIAVRNTSHLLLTSAASPTLFTLDPTTTNGTLDSVHTFPNATGLLGITEYRPGVFALVASILNVTTRRAEPGSIAIWNVDFNAKNPVVRILAAVPEALLGNGLTVFPGDTGILLLGDSDPSMQFTVPNGGGINGLHVQGDYLHFTNSDQSTFSRVALTAHDGNVAAAGVVQTLATIQTGTPDDFALDKQGRAWVTVHPGALTLLSPPGGLNHTGTWSQVTVAGNAEGTDAGLNQPTSAAFGRGDVVQEQILYVTTEAGQLVAVDTRSI